jgi:hypothetical protein
LPTDRHLAGGGFEAGESAQEFALPVALDPGKPTEPAAAPELKRDGVPVPR